MNKIIIINQFSNTPDLPGHTRQYELAQGLLKLGWDVTVFASDFNLTQRVYRYLKFPRIAMTQYYSGLKWCWLWVTPYRRNNWRRHVNIISFAVHIGIRLLFALLYRTLLIRESTVIIASSPQLPAAFICLLISRLTRSPFVLEVRDLWPQVMIDLGGKSKRNLSIRFLRYLERQLYTHADHVVVLAHGSESYVRDRGARQTSWLPNGPDLQLFTPQKLPDNKGLFYVLYAGAHGEANDLSNILDAARILEKASSNIRFRFVGDGPEKPFLVKISSDLPSVTFEDPVPKSYIPALMQEADAILISLADVPLFRYGVSPNKLYDAYALGRPVITTVPGSINNEVLEHRLGVTSPPNDPTSLASSILRLASTPLPERIRMSERAIALAHSTYSRERVIHRYHSLLLALIPQ